MLTQYTVRDSWFRRGDPGGDDELRGERQARMLMARQQERRELIALLGAPLYTKTTLLPIHGGGVLGPATGRLGQVLKWGLWSPHQKALIDIFPRLPSTEELEDRAAWASKHQLRYALVGPGRRLDSETLKTWLAQQEGARQ